MSVINTPLQHNIKILYTTYPQNTTFRKKIKTLILTYVKKDMALDC